MDIALPTPLLGGLSPQRFMRRHWQKRPLLVRTAVADPHAVVGRAELLRLAASDDVESRLIVRDGERWSLRDGPFARRALPPLSRREWTLLVQGADLHLEAAHRLLARFRFVPDARLDDLMFSFATDGGGVGPHVDSYDVFLLQLHGRRRWRIGRAKKHALRSDVPLKMLADFVPTDEWLLGPGDMLYLPPGWGHDGVAEGEAITASIGFRAPGATALGAEVLQLVLDAIDPTVDEPRYADGDQRATARPACIPEALRRYAERAVDRVLPDRRALRGALGEALSTPKRGVWFDPGESAPPGSGVRLDRRTRMLYDDDHVFINGEAFRAAGRDAKIVRRLADTRALDRAALGALSDEARTLVEQWIISGWVRPDPDLAAGKED